MEIEVHLSETAALQEQAEREHRSAHDVAVSAIKDYLSECCEPASIDAVLETELVRYSDALGRLGR